MFSKCRCRDKSKGSQYESNQCLSRLENASASAGIKLAPLYK